MDWNGTNAAGNVLVLGETLKRCLQDGHYWLTFEPEYETLTLYADPFGAAGPLFVIRCAGRDNAERLAADLGLEPAGRSDGRLWMTPLFLEDNGSRDARAVRQELVRLGLPFKDRTEASDVRLKLNGVFYVFTPARAADMVIGALRRLDRACRANLAPST